MITKEERAQIVEDAALGAGNVIHRLKAYGRPLDEEALWTDGTWQAPDGTRPAVLTLGELHEIVETYAGWYHAQGVRPRDPVAIQTFSSTEFAVNFLALTSLGAVPSFVNGNLRPETARAYVHRQGAVGALTDEAHHEVLAAGREESGLGFCVTGADVAAAGRSPLPPGYPYAHHATDPVIISHSSGTTGMPKAVPHTHETLLYAQLHRLKLSLGSSMGRLLVALPGSHNAAVSVMMFGFLLRSPVLMHSSQRGEDVLDAMESFRPSTVFAFAGTYGEMATAGLSGRDLGSVEAWYNTGDAAHEAHIAALIALGSHETIGRDLKRHRTPGSVFTDGLGSSETGYSLFHNGHRPGRTSHPRCVGKPMSFAQAAVLAEDGTPLPPGEVGRLGVRSPTLTPGYWNDSLTFHRLRLGGYWLTGDLAYRDEEGNFYHLDRAPDAIRTAAGVVFSTRTEELLLRELPALDDCTVVAVAPEDVQADWDGDGVADAYALLQARDGAPEWADARWTAEVNDVLTAGGLPPLAGALRMAAADVVKGATGKVLKREMRERFRARALSGGVRGGPVTATDDRTDERAGVRPRAMDVYRQWWLHDARWYQGVAARFGYEAANEINAEAMRYVAVQVGRRIAREFRGRPPADLEELRLAYDMCSEWMFPSELRDGGTAVLDTGEIELTMRQNFAVTMVRMAGSLAGYTCPCTDIHAGWSEGLGVELVENRATGCLRDGDPACRLLMRVADREADPAADPGVDRKADPKGAS